jgi:basic membrane protein A
MATDLTLGRFHYRLTTMTDDRRTFLKRAGTVGALALAGCTAGDGGDDTETETDANGGGGEDSTTQGTGDGATATASVDSDVNVGMVYATGGLGDKSFNDQAQDGAQQAKQQFGITFDEAQPSENTDFKPAQKRFAQKGSYDLINCIGFAQTDALTQNAKEFPDQNWAIVDSVVEQDNVANYVFKEHEGSYLAGVLAAMLTTRSFEAGGGSTAGDSTNVGFVGGLEVPLIKKFEAGFVAGVKSAASDIDVITNYVGSFNDPQGGKEAAASMYSSGADIVYHASGATGVGVFRAAKEAGKFAIGVDKDQSVTAAQFADVILASMVKRVDTAVFNAIKSQVQGNFKGGAVTTLGLQSNGVELVYGAELGAEISTEVKTAIKTAREGIIAGDIDVPTEP